MQVSLNDSLVDLLRISNLHSGHRWSRERKAASQQIIIIDLCPVGLAGPRACQLAVSGASNRLHLAKPIAIAERVVFSLLICNGVAPGLMAYINTL